MNLKITHETLRRLYARADDGVAYYGDLVLLGRDVRGIIRGFTLIKRFKDNYRPHHQDGCHTMGNYDSGQIATAAAELRKYNLIPTAYAHLQGSIHVRTLKQKGWSFTGTENPGADDWPYRLCQDHFSHHTDLPFVLVYKGMKPQAYVTRKKTKLTIAHPITVKVVK